MKKIIHKSILIQIIILTFSFTDGIYSQENFNISAGIGYPEYLNLGLHYKMDQVQFGVKYGTWPNKDIFLLSSELRMYFDEVPELPAKGSWFMLMGLNYLRIEDAIRTEKFLFVNFRMGYYVNMSRKIGMSLSLGILGVVNNEKIYKRPFSDGPIGGVDFSLLPGIGFELFYRI